MKIGRRSSETSELVGRGKDQDRFEQIKEWVTADLDFSAKWRTRAKKNFDFMRNDGQWDDNDRAYLAESKRPIVTFNLTSKFVKAICGLESNNRHDTVFLPREMDNAGEVLANETLTAASKWMADGCYADRHQSRAFRDITICGMGWTEATVSFDDDPKGSYVETRCDPLEMFWDKNARDQNLMDSKRRGRVRKMLLSEARALLPGVTDSREFSDEDLDAHWAAGAFDYSSKELKTKEEKELRAEARVDDDPRREVHIVQLQWWEFENYIFGFDPDTRSTREMSEQERATYSQMLGMDVGVSMRRKVYYQAFVGNRVLKVGKCPCPDGFTLNCMTGDPEDTTGYFSGIVDLLRDPAQWSNKFLSQALHMLNSTAKGGLLIEADAIGDIEEFRRGYAKSDQISVVRPGAISKGKIMAKPGTANLTNVLNLYEIAKTSFQDVVGLNLEIMGLADRQQPGVLEAQRKQAAMTILATLFDSLALFRMEVGRCRLHYIQTILADGRLIRVAGDDVQQAMPLIKDEVMGKYDVVVEDAPTSPNTREKTWATIQMLLPPLLNAGMVTPEMVLMLLDYVPNIPAKLVQALKTVAAKPNPQLLEQSKRDAREQEAKIEDLEQSAASKRGKTLLDLANAGAKAIEAETQAQIARTASGLDRVWPAGSVNVLDDEPEPMMPRKADPVAQLDSGSSDPLNVQLPGGIENEGVIQ